MRPPDLQTRHLGPARFLRGLYMDLRKRLGGYPHDEITYERLDELMEHIRALEADKVPTTTPQDAINKVEAYIDPIEPVAEDDWDALDETATKMRERL